MMEETPRQFGRPAPPRTTDPCDGVLLVDKPAGPSSHDIVSQIRRTFGFRKVGHGGTLDPAATGLLVILIGKGTKLSAYFLGSDKEYEGVMHLGITTDSQDAEGKIVREADWHSVTREQLEEVVKEFTGDILQVPPMMSAVKVDGVPLYKRARKGQVVERKSKLIHVYEFRLTDFSSPEVGFFLRCTKGTYVRTLCDDIGKRIGCGAHLARLRRIKSGDLSVTDAVRMDELLQLGKEDLLERLIPAHRFSTVLRRKRFN